MAVAALKIYNKEIRRRKLEHRHLQAKIDESELNRRVRAVESGESKILPEEKAEQLLKELGFYD
jgi:hypothetical protein